MSCEAVRAALVEALAARRRPGADLPSTLAAHLSSCASCMAEAEELAAVERVLAADRPAVPAGLATRTVAAVAPAVARRCTPWPAVARALGAALAVLPLALMWDLGVLGTAFHLLPIFLPTVLAGALLASYAVSSAVGLSLAVALVPVLAACAHPSPGGARA